MYSMFHSQIGCKSLLNKTEWVPLHLSHDKEANRIFLGFKVSTKRNVLKLNVKKATWSKMRRKKM